MPVAYCPECGSLVELHEREQVALCLRCGFFPILYAHIVWYTYRDMKLLVEASIGKE